MTYRTLLKSSSLALTTGCAVLLGMASGCGEDPEPVAAKPVAKKATAPPSTEEPVDLGPTPIADLMTEFNIDSRISMSEDNAPDNDADRIVVLRFFDGMVRGDDARLSSLLSEADALILERLVESGEWSSATGDVIEEIEIETDRGRGIGECALAIVTTTDGEFDVQLWNYELVGEPEADDGAVFDALPTPPDMVNRLSGGDWIATWLEIIDQEMARADEPDEAVEFESLILESEEEEAKPSGGSRPSGPGRKKPKAPVFNPSPGFGAPGGAPGRR